MQNSIKDKIPISVQYVELCFRMEGNKYICLLKMNFLVQKKGFISVSSFCICFLLR